jgi:molecular chaperone DnaK
MSAYVPVGIDLGTNRIRVAYVDSQGRVEMLRDERDEICLVNAVRFTSQEIIVGKDALAETCLFSPETAIWIKRELGSRTYSRAIHGQRLPPEVVQACVLRKVRAELTHRLVGPFACVIGVPSYFDEIRRNAVVNAGQIAGLRVVDVVDEPLATALAYAYAGGAILADQEGQGKTILIFDLGGSSLQVAIARLSASECRIVAKDQDVELGGYDFDVRLGEIVAEAMIAKGHSDPRADPAVWARLYRLIVDAKHGLSAQNRVSLVYDYEKTHFEMNITREQFEACTDSLLRRIERFLGRFLGRTGLAWTDVDIILPVGGAVRMPSIQRLLGQLSGQRILFPVNVDEAVARGAAMFGAWWLQEERGEKVSGTPSDPMPTFLPAPLKNREKVQFGNLLPYAVGVRTPDEKEEETICLASRATPLPLKVTHRLSVRDPIQGTLALIVAKNEYGSWEDCGRLIFHGIPEKAPTHVYLELTLECQVNGRLRFHARLMPTAEPLKTEFVVPSALEIDALERWQRTVEGSSSWQDLTQVMEPRYSIRDEWAQEANDVTSDSGEKRQPGQEKEGHETGLLPRRRHPRLAAAEAQGRWQSLEIALPPMLGDRELKPGEGAPTEPAQSIRKSSESPSAPFPTGDQPNKPPPSEKGIVIRGRPRVTRQAILEGLLSSETDFPGVVAAGSGQREGGFTIPQETMPDHQEPLVVTADESDLSRSHQPFRTTRRQAVRVLLPFGLTAPRWLVAGIGFVVSALLGLTIGYWIIIRLIPQSGLFKLW